MKAPRDTCKSCGIGLEPHEDRHGLCMRCAAAEITTIQKYFRNGLIVGVILALLVFWLLGVAQRGIAAMDPRMRNLNLDAIAALTATGRALWAALAFTVPFGYIHQTKSKGAPVDEAARTASLSRFGSPGFGFAGNISESAGVGFLILGILSAPVVGPMYAAYRLIRMIQLRRYIVKAT